MPRDVRLEDVAVAIAADLEEPVRVAHEGGRLAHQRKPHRSGWEARRFGPPGAKATSGQPGSA